MTPDRDDKIFTGMRFIQSAAVTFLCLLSVGYANAAQLEATLAWSKKVQLGTPVKGVIHEVLVKPGDRVNKGDVLIRLDQRGFKSRLTMAKAQVKSLDEKRKEAQRELDRALELYDRTVLSDHDLQQARNATVNAEAEYASARASLVQAELDLEYSAVRAPFAGVILQRYVEIGQTVVSEIKPEVLMVLAEAGKMRATSLVDHAVIAQLQPGHALTVTMAGRNYSGKLEHLGLEPVNSEGKYALDVLFETGDILLRAGQKAVIELP